MDLVGAFTKWENQVVNGSRNGAFVDQESASDRQSRATHWQPWNIPRSTREGVDVQFRSACLEVPAHRRGERGVLHQRRILGARNRGRWTVQSDGRKAVVLQVREKTEQSRVDARGIPRTVQRRIENAIRSGKHQRVLVVAKHRRHLVCVVIGLHVEAVNCARRCRRCRLLNGQIVLGQTIEASQKVSRRPQTRCTELILNMLSSCSLTATI